MLFAQTAVVAVDKEGESKFKEGYYRFDRAIRRFLMSGMDSTYVQIPSTSWEVPLVGKVYGYLTNISPNDSKLDLHVNPVFEIGAGIGYHGLDAVYTKAVRNSIDFNFEFDYYDNYTKDCLTKNYSTTTGHVFATVVTCTLYDGNGAGVAHTETLAYSTVDIQLTCGSAIKAGITCDDVILWHEVLA